MNKNVDNSNQGTPLTDEMFEEYIKTIRNWHIGPEDEKNLTWYEPHEPKEWKPLIGHSK